MGMLTAAQWRSLAAMRRELSDPWEAMMREVLSDEEFAARFGAEPGKEAS